MYETQHLRRFWRCHLGAKKAARLVRNQLEARRGKGLATKFPLRETEGEKVKREGEEIWREEEEELATPLHPPSPPPVFPLLLSSSFLSFPPPSVWLSSPPTFSLLFFFLPPSPPFALSFREKVEGQR